MDVNTQTHFVLEKENNSRLDFYKLAPGVSMQFNQIYVGSWEKGNILVSDRILNLNFCVNGRCEVSLEHNRYAIVKKDQVCISTISPDKDFYYPGKLYEGIQLFINLQILEESKDDHFLPFLGIHPGDIASVFCAKSGIYFRQMDNNISGIILKAWASKEDMDIPSLRYLTVRLLHEVMAFPMKSECETYFTRSPL